MQKPVCRYLLSVLRNFWQKLYQSKNCLESRDVLIENKIVIRTLTYQFQYSTNQYSVILQVIHMISFTDGIIRITRRNLNHRLQQQYDSNTSFSKSVIWPIVEISFRNGLDKPHLQNEMGQGVPSSAQTPIKIHEKYNFTILLLA